VELWNAETVYGENKAAEKTGLRDFLVKFTEKHHDRQSGVKDVLPGWQYSISAVRIFENSNRIVTLQFDSKRMQLFEIFQHLSLVDNTVFGNYTGKQPPKT